MKSLIALLGILAVSIGAATKSVADESGSTAPIVVTALTLSKQSEMDASQFPNHFERPMAPPRVTQTTIPVHAKTPAGIKSPPEAPIHATSTLFPARSPSFEDRIGKLLKVMDPPRKNVKGNLIQVFLLSPPQPNVTSDNYNPYTDRITYEVRYTISRKSSVVVNGSEGIWYEIDAERRKR